MSRLFARDLTTAMRRDALLKLRSPATLMVERDSRRLLLELLRPTELDELALFVLGDAATVRSVSAFDNLRANSESYRLLCRALEVPADAAQSAKSLPDHVQVVPTYALFDHQRKAADQVTLRLKTDGARVVLHMPTGSGKTRTAMSIVAQHLRSDEDGLVVWLATSEELCEQAIEEFEKSWRSLGNRPVQQSRAWGDHPFDRDAVASLRSGIVVAGLSKLTNAGNADATLIATLGDRVTFVVFDEAHQVVAPTYCAVIQTLLARNPRTRLLGLTATPGRTWSDRDEDKRLSQFFDNTKVTLRVEGYPNPIDYLIAEGYLARPTFRSVAYVTNRTLTDDDRRALALEFDVPPHIATQLATDDARNLAVLSEARNLLRRHRRVLLFAATVDHAELMAVLLRALGCASECVSGRTPAADRSRLVAWFKSDSDEARLLCNYGVLTTGFDAPKTSAALIARATKSLVLYSQMAGRAMRGEKAGGNQAAEIVTVVDISLPGFGDLSEAFTNWEDVWK